MVNWQPALYGRAHSLVGKEFHWGVSDCVLIAILCMDAMCNTHNWNNYKDKWSSKKQAIRFGKDNGTFRTWLLANGAVETDDPCVGDFVHKEVVPGMDEVGVVLSNNHVLTASEKLKTVVVTSLDLYSGDASSVITLRISEG